MFVIFYLLRRGIWHCETSTISIPARLSLILAMGLAKVDQARKKCPPVFSLITNDLQEHILRLEIIVDDSVVPEKPDSIGDSMDEHDFGFEREYLFIGGDVGVNGLELAVLTQ